MFLMPSRRTVYGVKLTTVPVRRFARPSNNCFNANGVIITRSPIFNCSLTSPPGRTGWGSCGRIDRIPQHRPGGVPMLATLLSEPAYWHPALRVRWASRLVCSFHKSFLNQHLQRAGVPFPEPEFYCCSGPVQWMRPPVDHIMAGRTAICAEQIMALHAYALARRTAVCVAPYRGCGIKIADTRNANLTRFTSGAFTNLAHCSSHTASV